MEYELERLAYEDELDGDDEAAMDSIEQEMLTAPHDETTPETNHVESSTSYLPAGAMPVGKDGNLSALAGEFWFPECRDCVCCQGFKHGCACCKNNGALQCTDPSCGGLVPSEGSRSPSQYNVMPLDYYCSIKGSIYFTWFAVGCIN